MIGLTVTKEIKKKNNLSQNVGDILTRGSFPQKWHGVENVVGGYQNRTDLHKDDGWRDVVQPTIGKNQRRGAIFFDEPNDVFTYDVIDLTQEEIESRIISSAQAQKEEFLNQKLKTQLQDDLQAITNDNEALENQSGFEIWADYPLGFSFEANFKTQSLDENSELKLYRVIQPHDKQLANEPRLAPALWTKLEFKNGIEIWSQPIGGDGKYPYIDPLTGDPYLVQHKGQIWQNNHNPPGQPNALNVWEPGVFGWIIFEE